MDRMQCSEKAEESRLLQGAGNYIWVGIYQWTTAKRATTSPFVSTE